MGAATSDASEADQNARCLTPTSSPPRPLPCLPPPCARCQGRHQESELADSIVGLGRSEVSSSCISPPPPHPPLFVVLLASILNFFVVVCVHFLSHFEPSSGEFRRIVAVVVYEGDEDLSGLLKAAKDLGVLLEVVVSIWIFAHFWIFLGEPFLSHFRRVS